MHRRDGASSPAQAAEGLICSQAGLPVVGGVSKEFLDAFKAKYDDDPSIYAPFTYDAANLLIAAMQKADSTDPAKYLPELQKISYKGATGTIEFDDKGDRKNAEITIFTMKGGKVEPVAVVKGGKSLDVRRLHEGRRSAPTAAAPAAPAPAPAPAPARRAEEVSVRPLQRRRRPRAPFLLACRGSGIAADNRRGSRRDAVPHSRNRVR